ncbi:MAG: phenylalanine--tRNA ligase subunit beta [Kiritimatiellae bacterium]|nr:phenylalanine--tRNA ligase subunit beta [Kiritimatiellia bacterium]
MKVPISWLNEFVDVSDLSVQALSDKLTFSGVEVEGIETVGGVPLDDLFVVGEVLTCDPHPDSDHLHVCKVSTGTEVLQIVCGAPNCAAGVKAPLAKIGAVVPEGGFKIKKGKLRGVESFGMLCSARELKLSDDHDGILLLPPETKTGAFVRDVVGGKKPQTVFDLEITWNRPDCLSVIGIAREFAAILGRPLKMPSVDFTEEGEDVNTFAKVRVENPDRCPRYTARVMTQVKDGESPEFMRERLELCGVRAISLTVDVTNYVMLECGQPLHAFDYRTLADRTIVVRDARENETIKTLDGIERKLDPSMLVIADAEKPSAVAGVMGGEGSEIAVGTEHVLLESALFDPANTKATATKLGLATEASFRFIRGVDTDLADWASRRAVSLLQRYGGAVVAKGVIDVDNRKPAAHEVGICFERVNTAIGVALTPDRMVGILNALGLKTVSRDERGAVFAIPSWRLDLTLEADLIEEIARMNGLDNIPEKHYTFVSNLPDGPFYAKKRCREALLGLGFSEAMHYSFLSQQELDAFDARNPGRRVVLPNPVSAEYGVLRDALAPQLMQSLGRNASRQVESAGLFEIGRVFLLTPKGQPVEEEHLSMGLMGPFGRSPIDRRRAVTNDEALFWLKGAVEQLFDTLHAGHVQFKLAEHPAMEPGYQVEIILNGRVIGWMGAVSAKIRHAWRMTSPMVLAEMRLAPLLTEAGMRSGTIKPPPQFPAVRRDIAFVADVGLTHEQVVKTIRKAAPAELTSVALFDIFQSKEIGKEKRSLAYALDFRSQERTLTDQEVNVAFAKIIAALKRELNVEVREN